jgi:hypothetical protein
MLDYTTTKKKNEWLENKCRNDEVWKTTCTQEDSLWTLML